MLGKAFEIMGAALGVAGVVVVLLVVVWMIGVLISGVREWLWLRAAHRREVERLRAIVAAADEFDLFLRSNVGTTADFPVRIVVDNSFTAREYCAKAGRLGGLLNAWKEGKRG